ncbi:MAG: DUF2301 domain-containing membrane protein [Thermodesulfovibrionales bacterium]|jgi:uncharacterized integral membrane protein
MEQWPTLEDQIESAGIHYPRSYDITYRTGYVLQSLGAVGFAVLFGMGSALQVIPLALFDAGIALSSLYLLVWKAEIKRFILSMTFGGIALQIISLFVQSHDGFFGEKIFLLGLAFTLAGGAGLVGKEAFCFRFNEGWALLAIYPLVIIPRLFGYRDPDFFLVAAGVIAVLQLSFLRRKLGQPLLKKCEGNVCGLPQKKG